MGPSEIPNCKVILACGDCETFAIRDTDHGNRVSLWILRAKIGKFLILQQIP
ncbi:Uncharacterised protein [Vibrio cholerae]|nr:Uncharacterised protein [Vibrio cholerae]